MWITGLCHWEGHGRLQSLVSGGGHKVEVSLGGPLSSNSTKLDGKAPSCPFFFPSHQPSSIWGGGSTQGHLALPQGSLEILYPRLCPKLPPLPLPLPLLCAPHHSQSPHPHFTQLSSLLSTRIISPNPLITSPSHLLYHFHNLPSLQLQLVRLLRIVVEVHFAPSLGTRRFGGVTWVGEE